MLNLFQNFIYLFQACIDLNDLNIELNHIYLF